MVLSKLQMKRYWGKWVGGWGREDRKRFVRKAGSNSSFSPPLGLGLQAGSVKGRLERSDSKSNALPIHITNILLLVASLITA